MKLKYIISIIYLLLLTGFSMPNTQAADALFPQGCRQTGYSFKYNVLILSPGVGQSQTLYFVHNKTSNPVKLFQMRSGEEVFTMHLNNEIKGNQWAAFASDEHQVKFICTIPGKESKYGEIADCKKLLELCEYTNVEFASNNHGNYWPVESNESMLETRREVIEQGILLRW